MIHSLHVRLYALTLRSFLEENFIQAARQGRNRNMHHKRDGAERCALFSGSGGSTGTGDRECIPDVPRCPYQMTVGTVGLAQDLKRVGGGLGWHRGRPVA